MTTETPKVPALETNPALRGPYIDYLLRLGDSALIFSHRLQELTGHGPALEEEISLGNIALDHLGQAREILTHAGALEGAGRDEDRLAFFRTVREYRNLLLCELENGDFATVVARCFVYDLFQSLYLVPLKASVDPTLAAIAAKAEKEVRYHLRHSANWVKRLGDGTEESHRRMQDAIQWIWPYTGEMITHDADEAALVDAGLVPDRASVAEDWRAKATEILQEATLTVPPMDIPMQMGGLRGMHGEALGHILDQMQSLPRQMPEARW